VGQIGLIRNPEGHSGRVQIDSVNLAAMLGKRRFVGPRRRKAATRAFSGSPEDREAIAPDNAFMNLERNRKLTARNE